MRMVRGLIRTLIPGVVLALGVVSFAPAAKYLDVCLVRQSTATISSACGSFLTFDASAAFSPEKLPRHELAPVAVNLRAKVHEADGSRPPALKEVIVDFDKSFAVEAAGLQSCGKSEIDTLGVGAARRICRAAIVGTGLAHVEVESPGVAPFVVGLPLTIFNGGVRGGVTTMLIHSFAAQLASSTILAVVKVRKVDDGRFGLEATSTIPKIAEGYGSVLDFGFTVKRHLESDGTRQAYAMAKCPDGHLNTRLTIALTDGTGLAGSVVRACNPA